MTEERIMRRLRAANPVPAPEQSPDADEVFTRIVAAPGDGRLTSEQGATPGRARGFGLLRRPRVLAGSTLGLAGVGAALVIALGTSATTPAFAITRSDGSVTVALNGTSGIVSANNQLAAMGIHEQFGVDMAPGPAPVSGAVSCQPKPGESVSGPIVKVLVGKDGTEVNGPGNTGEGTFHLGACYVSAGTGYTGGTGNSGI